MSKLTRLFKNFYLYRGRIIEAEDEHELEYRQKEVDEEIYREFEEMMERYLGSGKEERLI